MTGSNRVRPRQISGVPLFLLLALLLPLPSDATQVESGPVFRGSVTDAESGVPLATAYVSLYRPDGTEASNVLTDEEGRYLLPAPNPGTYRLRAERIGYHPKELGPFTVSATDTLAVAFQLSPAPFILDSILVSVRRQGRSLGAGEQLVYGRLLDDESGEPIPQGTVRLLGGAGAVATTLSDDGGLFWLESPRAGTYSLQAERIGYRTSTGPEIFLMLGDTLGLDFYLSVEAVLMNPIVVRATARALGDRYEMTGMSGFLQRYSRFAKAGIGDFLTRDSIAKYEDWATSTGHVMMMTMMSVRYGNPLTAQVILRGHADAGGCAPRYFVNGLPAYPDALNFPPEMLEAVEVYVRPNIPAQFLMGGFPCGVVVLWTRRAPNPGSGITWWQKTLFGLGFLALGLLATLL